MAESDDRELLKRIERRVTWLAHTVIGSISFVVYFYIDHSTAIRDAWGLSDDGRFWLAVGTSVLVAGILEVGFNRS
jgi:hypothetical protein